MNKSMIVVAFVCLAAPAHAKDGRHPVARVARGGATGMLHAGSLGARAFFRGDFGEAFGHMNPVNVGLLMLQHTLAPDARSGEKRTWVQGLRFGGTEQSGMVDGDGRVFAQTRADVHAPTGTAAPKLKVRAEGSWQPWYGGGYRKTTAEEHQRRTGRRPAKGAVTYRLKPTGAGIEVDEELRSELDADGYRGTIQLDGHARGLAQIRLERRGAESTLTGEFQGVKPGGFARLLGPATFGLLHLAAEGGTKLLPKTGIGLTEERGFGRLARELER